MGRPKNTIRVSLKGRDGKTTRLNVRRLLDGSLSVYRDGKRRGRMSATEFGKRITQWIKGQE